MKLCNKIIAAILVSSHLLGQLALAAGPNITPQEVLKHLEDRSNEFDRFYAEEQRWIKEHLMPVASALIESKRKIENYNREVDSWGSLLKIEQDRDVLRKIRAAKILENISLDFAVLFVSHLNLIKASDKHQSQITEFSDLVSQNSAAYQDLVVNLNNILSIYEKYEFDNRYQEIISAAQKRILENQKRHNLAMHDVLKYEIEKIHWLLENAERRSSRYTWMSALNAHQRLLERARDSGFDPNIINNTYKEVRNRKISITQAKDALIKRVEKIKTSKSEDNQFVKNFARFLKNPRPTYEEFRKIETELSNIEMRDLSASLYPTKSSQKRPEAKFCMGPAPALNWDQNPHKPGEERTQYRVYEKNFLNGSGVTERRVVVEKYTSSWTGDSDFKQHSFAADSPMIDKVRAEFQLGPNDPLSATKGQSEYDPNFTINGEFGPSTNPNPLNKIISSKTEVTVKESDTKTEYSINLAPKVTPDTYKDRPEKIYAGKDFERSEMQISAEDLSRKTKAFNKSISAKSQELAQKIESGETALAASIGSIKTYLENELQGKDGIPEVTNTSLTLNESSLRHSIKTTRLVITTLSKKNEHNPEQIRRQVQQGLESASKLVDSAELALNEDDQATAKDFLELSHSIIRDYGGLALRIGVSLTPAGDVLDLVELITGKDAFSGVKLSTEERALAGLGLIIGSRAFWSKSSKYLDNSIENIIRGSEKIGDQIKIIDTFDGRSARNFLDKIVVDKKTGATARSTFRSGKGKIVVYNKPQKAYRVTHESGSPYANFYTPNKPQGPTAAIIDLALPGAKNPAVKIFEVEIPANTEIAIGVVGQQGHLPGGAIQYVIKNPKVVKNIKEVIFNESTN